MNSESVVVPPELVDHILSFLERDIGSLRCCSDALRAVGLSSLARKLLYKSVRVYESGEGTGGTELKINIARLSRLLKSPGETNPKDYIQTLYIHFPLPPLASPTSSILTGHQFTALLSEPHILPSLRSIRLPPRPGRRIRWTKLDRGFRQALLNRLRSSGNQAGIDDFRVIYIDGFPLHELESCQKLRTLFVQGDVELSPPLKRPQDEPLRLRLDKLSFRYASPPLIGNPRWWEANGISSRLQSLELEPKPTQGYGDLPLILDCAKETLQELTLRLTAYPASFYHSGKKEWSCDISEALSLSSFLDLNALTALTNLTIYSKISAFISLGTSKGSGSWSYISAIREIGELLGTLKANHGGDNCPSFGTRLTEIVLKLKSETDRGYRPTLAYMDFKPLLHASRQFPSVLPASTSASPTTSTTQDTQPLITLHIILEAVDSASGISSGIEDNDVVNLMVQERRLRVV